MSKPRPTVLDAGPLIHLDELACLDLLEGLDPLRAPDKVWEEVSRHRPQLHIDAIPHLELLQVAGSVAPEVLRQATTLALQTGEIHALHLALQEGADLFLTDDSAARLAAEALGLKAHGAVGILVRAIRRKTRTARQVRELIASIPDRSTLHLSRALLEKVLAALPE